MAITPKYETGLGRALWRKLLQLDSPVPSRTSAETEAEIERNYRWNFTFNFLDGSTFFFGANFVSAATVIPLFVSKLTLNPLIIGLVAILAQAGWSLPQILTAGYIEGVPRKKPVIINLGFFTERLPVWLWPLSALMAPFHAGLALALFFIAYAWHNLGAGTVAPAWQDLVARCFPVNRRGHWFGLTTFFGTGTGALGALASAWILENFAYPYNFFYAFLIAAIFINLSWVFLSFTREPTYPTDEPATVASTNHFWARLLNILRQDSNFRHYLQARLVMTLGGLGMGFITVSAIERWQVSDGTVGFFTFALLLGQGGGNLLAGWLADRLGHKVSLEIGAALGVIGFGLTWIAPAPEWYYASFFFLGASIGMSIVSGTLISMEFSLPTQRPTYMGTANTVVGLGGVIAPLMGGLLAIYGYGWTFGASVIVGLIGLALIHWTVREPRWQ